MLRCLVWRWGRRPMPRAWHFAMGKPHDVLMWRADAPTEAQHIAAFLWDALFRALDRWGAEIGNGHRAHSSVLVRAHVVAGMPWV